MGAIDIVCNLFTETEIRNGQTGLDDYFLEQIRMPEKLRKGVSMEEYLKKWTSPVLIIPCSSQSGRRSAHERLV